MSTFLSGMLTLLFSATSLSSFGQDFTNKGTEFYLCFPTQFISGGSNFPNMKLFITGAGTSTGKVEIPGVATPAPFSIDPFTPLAEINIPYSNAYISDGETGLVVNKGIRVIVDPGKDPVVVYAHIYVAALSAASLILPTAVLGKKYITTNCFQNTTNPSWRSQFQVVAVEDNTQIKITPRLNGMLNPLLAVTKTLPLKGDVYQYQATEDLTGTLIESVEPAPGGTCKRIAVFSGSSAVAIETITGCATGENYSVDPLFQQMFPINSWGKKYAFVPFAEYANGNPYRVVASENSTKVFENGVYKATINAEEFYPSVDISTGKMLPSNTPVFITADKPISVAQYAQMARCRATAPYELGDPDMLLLNPIEQGVNNITVFSSTKENITKRYIQIVIKQDASSSFKINGGSFLITTPWLSVLPLSEGYVYNKIPIPLTSSTHSFTLTADKDFVASVYGFGDKESYAYSAGANFNDLSQTLNTQNGDTLINFPASCVGTPMKFSITSPYQVTSINWDFSDFAGLFTFSGGAATDTTILPVPPSAIISSDSSWVMDGKSFYRYDLKKQFTVSSAGEKIVKVTANIINPDGCSGVQEITYKLKIYERPVARIKQNFSGAVCLGSPVNLTDSSDGKGRATQKFIWADLSGGGVSYGTTWSKIFTSSGTKRVGHLVLNDIGCVSDTFFQPVVVNPLPVADFASSSAICERRLITFTNTSTDNAAGNSILLWTLPNGTTSTAPSVTWSFASTGNSIVKLKVTNANGCIDNLDSTITVFPTPGAFFDLPKICRYDPANLTAQGTVASGTISAYQWNVAGTPYSTPVVSHTFSTSGDQLISLKIISDKGCDSTYSKMLIVNGVLPRPVFTITSPSPICSNTFFKLTDASVVLDGGGPIFKIKIQWDALNDPSNDTVDLSPQAGSIYSYLYPSFTNPPIKSYEIHYRVYSGENIACQYDSVFSIDVKASPVVDFPAVGPVCQDSAPFFLVATPPTGVFSGTGVTPAGLFSPKLASPSNLITYTISDPVSACSGQAQQPIIVWPSPVADAGPSFSTVPAGNSLTLSGSVSSGLSPYSYQWEPISLIAGPATTQMVTITPANDTLFRFLVTDSRGCKGADSIKVVVLLTLKIPNAFTPNGDLVNDTWRIANLNAYPGATVQIFNRYGQLVFRSAGYAKEWDGTINGNPLPVGTYYWVIDPKNGKLPMSGSVTIIR